MLARMVQAVPLTRALQLRGLTDVIVPTIGAINESAATSESGGVQMSPSREVEGVDDLRRRGEISWEQYGTLLKGKFVATAGEYMGEIVRGIRDKDGRLRELKDLGGYR
jgi:hypothetical protein